MNKVIVNKNYLKLLEAGIPIEHINTYANEELGLITPPKYDIPCVKELPEEIVNYTKADVEATHAFITGLDTDGPDPRYNVPKVKPHAAVDTVEKTIVETEIYRKAKLAILQAQKKQVGYGIDKYPEPLNANTWSTIETIDHIIEESIDKLHYLVMLRIKLEQELVK